MVRLRVRIHGLPEDGKTVAPFFVAKEIRMPVDTKTVTGRRVLRFESLDDILSELASLEGKQLKTLGNWSAGQILAHVAVPMNAAIDGMKFAVPWYIRTFARLFKKKILSGTAPPGFKLPKAAEAELIPGPTSVEEGLAAVRKAINRLKTESHREPSHFLGPLTVEEWNQLNCRHCELHLSFIVPE